ncbi:hypothetical protein BKA70DRAFT_336152 [Coprinopsis sp. MPI-PUGE-AT-0042]|nr:hypothetical protein BKA70DRAFT_336152 [Coprinopsis sp. MPI-PUGE-AT-0042]
MHHRAVALVASRAHILPAPSFSAALQLAAARAWVRRSSTTPGVKATTPMDRAGGHGTPHSSCARPVDASGPSNLASTGCDVAKGHSRNRSLQQSVTSVQETHESGQRPEPPASPPRPTVTSRKSQPRTIDSPPLLSDPSHLPPSIQPGEPAPGPLILHEDELHRLLVQPPPRDLPQPKSHDSFHQSLLRLIYFTRPSLELPQILDFYRLYPQYHTTYSYNVILALALRHNAFGAVRSLLLSMKASRIRRNQETWKLETRYLVQTGSWNQAWRIITRPDPLRGISSDNIPLPIWIEFFQLTKPGYIASGETMHKRPSPFPDPDTWDPRLRLLFQRAPKELATPQRVPPRDINTIVSFFLRLQRPDRAMEITTSYLRALPRRLTPSWRKGCVDLLNSHVALGSSGKGVRNLERNIKTLKKLCNLHSGIRPDATTLFALLSPLKKVAKCATTANRFTQFFMRQWCKEADLDLRVRRRIVTLALKEGRLDLAKAYSEEPELIATRHPHALSARNEASITRLRLRRLSDKILFPRTPKERHLLFIAKLRLKVALWEDKQRGCVGVK